MQDLSIWSWLQSRFPASSKDWTVGELVRAAFLEHGVNVQSEGALFQFKYEFSVVKWTLYSGQARGIIMKRANNCWIPVAIPFFKFFNQQESKCPVQSGQAFALALKEGMMFVEKADGTGIQLWFDGETNADDEQHQEEAAAVSFVEDDEVTILPPEVAQSKKREKFRQKGMRLKERNHESVQGWRVSTFGTITTEIKFERLFWDLFGRDSVSKLDRSYTYLFELCSRENRVVTRYPSDRLFALAARKCHISALSGPWPGAARGEELLPLDQLPVRPPYVVLPARFLAPEEVQSLQSAIQFVEQQSRRSDLGELPEGFVLCSRAGVPLAKMKNSAYLQHHLVATGNILQVRSVVVEMFFEEKLDDVLESMPPWAQLFAAELQLKLKKLTRDAADAAMQVASSTEKRERAELIAQRVASEFRPFVHSLKNDKDEVVEQSFVRWIKSNYKRFGALWTTSQVATLVAEEERMQKSKLWIVAGLPGSGKSETARRLTQKEPRAAWCVLDSDMVSERVIKAGLGLAGRDVNDRDSAEYKLTFRDAVYETMYDLAAQNLQCCKNVVLAAPFSTELRDEDWDEKLKTRTGAGSVEVLVVVCSEETRRERMIKRGAERDTAKLKLWENKSLEVKCKHKVINT